MKIRGTIKNINFTENTIAIKFKDTLEYNGKTLIVSIDKEPDEDLKDKEFYIGVLDKNVLYQLFKDRQLLLFIIEKNEANKDTMEKNRTTEYTVKSLETIDE